MRRRTEGFSLIEMLAATVILGVLITVVLAPLTSLFKRTGTNGQTLQVTTQAQGVLEALKGQWRTLPTPVPADYAGDDDYATAKANADVARDTARNNYDRSCFPSVSVPASATVVVRGVDRNGTALGTLSCSSTPPLLADIPVMKRVSVTLKVGDAQTVLSTDVPRPPANDTGNSL